MSKNNDEIVEELNLMSLPDEVLLNIGTYFNRYELLNIALTCNRLSQISSDNSLWKIPIKNFNFKPDKTTINFKQFFLSNYNNLTHKALNYCKDISHLIAPYNSDHIHLAPENREGYITISVKESRNHNTLIFFSISYNNLLAGYKKTTIQFNQQQILTKINSLDKSLNCSIESVFANKDIKSIIEMKDKTSQIKACDEAIKNYITHSPVYGYEFFNRVQPTQINENEEVQQRVLQ